MSTQNNCRGPSPSCSRNIVIYWCSRNIVIYWCSRNIVIYLCSQNIGGQGSVLPFPWPPPPPIVDKRGHFDDYTLPWPSNILATWVNYNIPATSVYYNILATCSKLQYFGYMRGRGLHVINIYFQLWSKWTLNCNLDYGTNHLLLWWQNSVKTKAKEP